MNKTIGYSYLYVLKNGYCGISTSYKEIEQLIKTEEWVTQQEGIIYLKIIEISIPNLPNLLPVEITAIIARVIELPNNEQYLIGLS
jgi:hypothetical protein